MAEQDGGLPEGESPPQPPNVRRAIRLTWGQRILLPLLLAVVLLALAGAFGESRADIHATSGSLDVRLTCPSRLRYRQSQSLELEVRNSGGARLDEVRVGLDQDYLSHFAAVHVMPPDQPAATVSLGPLEPGAAARMTIELAGDDYWRHRGVFAPAQGRAGWCGTRHRSGAGVSVSLDGR